ncbi:hypothetical protein C8J56DRAFT_112294 [Mycena floridula]|nr:hypothetical protein C8J56DRAFT_112294 [Mycena floridula]
MRRKGEKLRERKRGWHADWYREEEKGQEESTRSSETRGKLDCDEGEPQGWEIKEVRQGRRRETMERRCLESARLLFLETRDFTSKPRRLSDHRSHSILPPRCPLSNHCPTMSIIRFCQLSGLRRCRLCTVEKRKTAAEIRYALQRCMPVESRRLEPSFSRRRPRFHSIPMGHSIVIIVRLCQLHRLVDKPRASTSLVKKVFRVAFLHFLITAPHDILVSPEQHRRCISRPRVPVCQCAFSIHCYPHHLSSNLPWVAWSFPIYFYRLPRRHERYSDYNLVLLPAATANIRVDTRTMLPLAYPHNLRDITAKTSKSTSKEGSASGPVAGRSYASCEAI